MIDRYTKTVLTLIALGLLAIAAEGAAPRAVAESEACGRMGDPCYVSNHGELPLVVETAP